MRYLYSVIYLVAVSAAEYAAPYITPGAGWDTTTFTPAAIGSPGDDGYDATVIARWDVVPWQSFTDSFSIGIVAFHINGIEKVSFAAAGGGWTDITEMTLNPRTNVWEYQVMLRAVDFAAEGEIEIRAIAYPKTAGRPRVMADSSSTHQDLGDGSLYLVADQGGLSHPTVWVDDDGNDTTGDGSEGNPYQTIDKAIAARFPSSVAAWSPDQSGILDGVTIYLKAGSYLAPTTGYYDMGRWVTVTSAPGEDPGEVIITGRGGGRCNIQLLKFDNLTWQPDGDQTIVSPSKADRYAWFSRVNGVGGDRKTYGSPWVNMGHTFYTDTRIYNFTQGVQTWNGATWLVRNVDISHIAEDAFRVNKMIVNCTVDDMDKEGSAAHPDVIQTSGNNFIVYNLKATNVKAQGIYITGLNWAMVNTFIQQDTSTGYYWQIDKIDSVQHCLLWHCGTVSQALLWRTGDATYNCRYISIRNCAFQSMGCGTNSQGEATDCAYLADSAMVIDNDHFIGSAFNQGTNATTGDPVFTDAGTGDFRPADGSPLRKRSTAGLVPCDVENNPRGDTTAIGAFAAADEQATAIDDGHMTIDKQQHLAVWPNPMGKNITINLETPRRGVSTVNVYDRIGNMVWARVAERNVMSLRWDGTNPSGQPVPPGVYYISEGNNVTRIIKTR